MFRRSFIRPLRDKRFSGHYGGAGGVGLSSDEDREDLIVDKL